MAAGRDAGLGNLETFISTVGGDATRAYQRANAKLEDLNGGFSTGRGRRWKTRSTS